MPGMSIESLIRGSVRKEDKRGRVASSSTSRPSYSSNSRYSNANGDWKSSHTHSYSHGDDKLSREKQWVQNSNSAKPTVPVITAEPDEPPPAYSETTQTSLPSSRSISRSPQPPSVPPINTLPRLQLPVIIPQNPRDGGFCRAYAPLLEECKVSEQAFFYFLDDFDRSAQASPYFSAVNIASIGSLNRPHSTAMIVALARKRINTFLDRVNTEFFQPRGLFCLIVTWRPDINKTHETVNIEDPIFSTSTRSLPFPNTAHLEFPLGNPTENMEPTRDLPPPNMYGPTSPAYGRGAGIPRLAGADPYYYDPYGYGYNDYGYGTGMRGMGMGGLGGMGMGRMGYGGMGGMGGMGMMGGRGGFGGGIGGPLGLIAGYLEDKMISKSQPTPQYYGGGPNAGYDSGYNNGYMTRGAPSAGSNSKAFKKDTIYLMVVNLPSDDELSRFGASS